MPSRNSRSHTNEDQSGDIRPIPDPTELTTRQLAREMIIVREIIELRLRVVETRLDGMDKAIDLAKESSNHIPEHISEKVESLKAVTDEKFGSIQTQFRERDAAVRAALDAAEKAVGKQTESFVTATAKSDQLTGKQMEQMSVQMQNDGRGKDDKINDLKDRVTRIEGRDTGSGSAWSGVATICGIISGLISLIIAATAIVVTFVRH